MTGPFSSKVSPGDPNSKVVDREALRGLSIISKQLDYLIKEIEKMANTLTAIGRKK